MASTREGRLTPLKGGRLEGWGGERPKVIRRRGLVSLLESKDLFSINKFVLFG